MTPPIQTIEIETAYLVHEFYWITGTWKMFKLDSEYSIHRNSFSNKFYRKKKSHNIKNKEKKGESSTKMAQNIEKTPPHDILEALVLWVQEVLAHFI